MHRLSAAILALALALGAAPARADEARAAAQFAEGQKDFEKGDFKGAARAFEGAYREAPHPAPLYNAGLAWLGAGRLDHAADAFAAALAMEGLTAEQHSDAETRLAEARKVLAVLKPVGVAAGVEARVDDGPLLPASGELHGLAGTRELTVVDAQGQETKRSVTVPKADGRSIEVRFDAEPTKPASGAGLPPRIVIGLSMFGAAALLGGAAIGTGVAGLSTRDDFVAAQNEGGSSREELASLRDDAVSLKIATNVLWGLAGTALIGGGVATALGLVEPAEGGASASLVVTPGFAAVRGHF